VLGKIYLVDGFIIHQLAGEVAFFYQQLAQPLHLRAANAQFGGKVGFRNFTLAGNSVKWRNQWGWQVENVYLANTILRWAGINFLVELIKQNVTGSNS